MLRALGYHHDLCVESPVRKLTLLFGVVLAYSCGDKCVGEDESAAPIASTVSKRRVTYQLLESIRPAEINADLKAGVPTVDIAIYLCETKKKPHGYVASQKELVLSFQRAKEIFAKAGVNLKLVWVKRAQVPDSWLALQANEIKGVLSPPELNAYVGYRRAKWELTEEARKAFEQIIEPSPFNQRTVYLLYLKEVRMAYFDRSDDPSRAQIKSIPTGGLSLPAYLFESRMPHRIRGVITLCKQSGKHGRTMAHELGHKLINVSHEYRHIPPQFEVRGQGGLMLYGAGIEIPSGKDGRWHRERLHLSPFIYRTQENATRLWNAEYKESGHYYDPLYRDRVIRFGAMDD